MNCSTAKFRQPRPDLFVSLAHASGYAYPSGHALLSVCLYGYLAAVLKAVGVPGFDHVLIEARVP